MRDHDDKPTCRVLRAGGSYEGRQGFRGTPGVSAGTPGAKGLCLMLLAIEPRDRKAHLHERHETAICIISGESVMRYGERVRIRTVAAGTQVGHGATRTAARPSRIAPVAAVAGDTAVPLAGTVSMDTATFDVTDAPHAAEAGTIGDEILASLGGRHARSDSDARNEGLGA